VTRDRFADQPVYQAILGIRHGSISLTGSDTSRGTLRDS
jgi:hypothetical protein